MAGRLDGGAAPRSRQLVSLSTTTAIAAGDELLLDSSTIIAYLNASEAASPAARFVLESLVATQRNLATVSAITVAEVLVRPMRELGTLPSGTKTFLLDFPGLSVRSVDFLVAAEAAAIRARTSLSMPDALIAATATLVSARWLISNDRQLARALAELDWETKVLLLADIDSGPG
jgi:predicted nucleic acid-binding protein